MSKSSKSAATSVSSAAVVEAASAAVSDDVEQLKALIASLGAGQVLLTLGQTVTRGAEDFEAGIKFGRRCANMARKVPAIG